MSTRPAAADGDPHAAAAKQGGRGRPLPARTAPVHKPVRLQGPVSMGQDLVRAISGAAAAVEYVDAVGSSPAVDFSIVARATTVCVGDTEADALQAAADENRRVRGFLRRDYSEPAGLFPRWRGRAVGSPPDPSSAVSACVDGRLPPLARRHEEDATKLVALSHCGSVLWPVS